MIEAIESRPPAGGESPEIVSNSPETIEALLHLNPLEARLHGLLWEKSVRREVILDTLFPNFGKRGTSSLDYVMKKYKAKIMTIGKTVVNVGRRKASIYETCNMGEEEEARARFAKTNKGQPMSYKSYYTPLEDDSELSIDPGEMTKGQAVYKTFPTTQDFKGYRRGNRDSPQPLDIGLIEERLALNLTYLYITRLKLDDERERLPRNAEELIPGALPADKLQDYIKTRGKIDWNQHVSDMIRGVIEEITQEENRPGYLDGKKMNILRTLNQLDKPQDEIISGVYEHFKRGKPTDTEILPTEV